MSSPGRVVPDRRLAPSELDRYRRVVERVIEAWDGNYDCNTDPGHQTFLRAMGQLRLIARCEDPVLLALLDED